MKYGSIGVEESKLLIEILQKADRRTFTYREIRKDRKSGKLRKLYYKGCLAKRGKLIIPGRQAAMCVWQLTDRGYDLASREAARA